MKKNKIFKKMLSGRFIVILLSCFVVITSVTYSWFTLGVTGGVDRIDIDVIGSADVYISFDQVHWDKGLEIDTTGATISEISGDGKNFFLPVATGDLDSNNKPIISSYYRVEKSDDPKVEQELQYIDIKFYLKTDKRIKLYLSSEKDACKLIPSYPSLKDDAASGAVRVGFVSKAGPYIWIPNTKYEFSDNSINRNGNVEQEYTFVESSLDVDIPANSLRHISTLGNESGVDESGKVLWGDLSKIDNYYDKAKPILVTDESDKEFIVPVSLRIWLEGTDRECVKNSVNGKFRFNIGFTCVTTEKVSG